MYEQIIRKAKRQTPTFSIFKILEIEGIVTYLTEEEFNKYISEDKLNTSNYKKIGTYKQSFIEKMQ